MGATSLHRCALRVVISAGPTREPIDPVRFISNYSTGAMGARLAEEALKRGHRVAMVCGPISEPLPRQARIVAVESAAQMARALTQAARRADVVIMAAAVSDFRPVGTSREKLHRRGSVTLRLAATEDILGGLPSHPGQVRVGFAVETTRVVARAMRKLREKRLDLLVAQQVNGAGSPFGRRPVHAWLIARQEGVRRLGRRSKRDIARLLLDKIEALWYGQHQDDKHA